MKFLIKSALPVFAICICVIISCASHQTIDPGDWDLGKSRVLATGFNHPEGPMLDREGNLYITEYRETVISKIAPDGTVTPVIDTGFRNNGLLFDQVENLYIICWTGKRIMKLDPNGELSLVTATSEGDSLNGPNDLVWGSDGRIYFTDPTGTSIKNPVGTVRYIDTDGKTKQFADGLAYPNGLVFDKDKAHLYVGDNGRNRILRYRLNPDGLNGGYEVFFEFEQGVRPDGMKMDVRGNIWAAMWSTGELRCISPEGKLIYSVQMPGERPRPTNILFGGPDMRTAYVTVQDGADKGTVYMLDMPVAGLPIILE